MRQTRQIRVVQLFLDISFALLLLECVRADEITVTFLILTGLYLSALLIYVLFRGSLPLYRPNIYFGICAVFILYSVYRVCTGGSMFPSVSMDMVKRLAVNFCLCYTVYLYFRINGIEHTIDVMVTTAAWFLLYALIRVLPGGLESRMGEKIGFNANVLAMFLGFMSGFAYQRYWETEKKNKYLWLMAFFFIGVLLTGSRKGLLTCVGGIVGIDFLMTEKRRKVQKLLILCIGVVVLLSCLLNIPVLYRLLGSRIESILTFLYDGKIEESSLATRVQLVSIGWEKIQDAPWTGFGLNTFRYYDARHGLYSHNNYIELLFSGGIPLTVIYYSLHVWLLGKSLAISKHNGMSARIGTVMILTALMILNDIGSVSYYSKYTLILKLLLVCMVCREQEQERKQEKL